jgi:UDP-N-acetylglucosamine 1-carboxyvinyltransferase
VLCGATVDANDLRGGAGLVLAGLFAKGITRVNNTHHVERGYFDLIGALKDLGADARLTN